MEELEVRGNGFGRYSLTLVLYDTNLAQLKRSAAECFKIFAAHDAQLIEERYNLLNAFIASHPGNPRFNLRRLWLLSRNYADLSFLFGSKAGESRNGALNGPYMSVFESSHGTPFYFNIPYDGVAHTFVTGATGSGKSFLMNFLLTDVQKYRPYTFIFDLGGSYESLTRLFGGHYTKVTATKLCINPCATLTQRCKLSLRIRESAQEGRP